MVAFQNAKIGKLIRRYKRFFMDIDYEGEVLTCYCPNTGKMTDLLEVNNPVIFVPQEKGLLYRVEAIFAQNEWVGINTSVPNKLAPEILNIIKPNLVWKKEFRFDKYRCDFRSDNIIIEAKNVHWKKGDGGFFPDCITERGSRQLDYLAKLQLLDFEVIMIYICQRASVSFIAIDPVDKLYFEKSKKINKSFAANCEVSLEGIKIKNIIPFV